MLCTQSALFQLCGGFALSLSMIMLPATCDSQCIGAGVDAQTQEPEQVPFERIPMDRYQNFLKNWEDAKVPVLVALIRNPKEYDQLFGAAAVIGNRKEFAPPNEFYAREQLLVVSRVIAATGEPEKVFAVERLLADGPRLTLSYNFKAPKEPATSQQKVWMTLMLPKKDFTSVRFIENGKEVGTLDVAAGQFTIPVATDPAE